MVEKEAQRDFSKSFGEVSLFVRLPKITYHICEILIFSSC
jgi:hypothetical protein